MNIMYKDGVPIGGVPQVSEILVKTTTITESFSSGKSSQDTSLSNITILSAELLGNGIEVIPQVSSGAKIGYAFVALNSNNQVDTSISGSKSINIVYIDN